MSRTPKITLFQFTCCMYWPKLYVQNYLHIKLIYCLDGTVSLIMCNDLTSDFYDAWLSNEKWTAQGTETGRTQ